MNEVHSVWSGLVGLLVGLAIAVAASKSLPVRPHGGSTERGR